MSHHNNRVVPLGPDGLDKERAELGACAIESIRKADAFVVLAHKEGGGHNIHLVGEPKLIRPMISALLEEIAELERKLTEVENEG